MILDKQINKIIQSDKPVYEKLQELLSLADGKGVIYGNGIYITNFEGQRTGKRTERTLRAKKRNTRENR